jgi:hypothetical protein
MPQRVQAPVELSVLLAERRVSLQQAQLAVPLLPVTLVLQAGWWPLLLPLLPEVRLPLKVMRAQGALQQVGPERAMTTLLAAWLPALAQTAALPDY